MPVSLTSRRAATEAIRVAARASLANAAKPVLHLNLANEVAPTSVATASVETASPAPAPTAPAPVDKFAERFRWRCQLVQMFERSYKPDAERMKQARAFAHSRRASINAAFDRGELKAAVLESLAEAFEAEPARPAAKCEGGTS